MPEIQACKVKIFSAPKTRGFEPWFDITGIFAKEFQLWPLAFSFEKILPWNASIAQQMIIPLRNRSVHCIQSQVSKKKKKVHTRSFWRCGTTLSFLSLIHARSFGSLGSCKKDPKDKDTRCESFVFWVFLHNLNDPNNLVWIRPYHIFSVKHVLHSKPSFDCIKKI